MNQSSLFFIFLFGSLSLPLFSQTAFFPTPTAKRDSLTAQRLIQSAQRQIDSAHLEAALLATQEAERLLRLYADESSPLFIDVYCLKGLVWVRSADERQKAFSLAKKVRELIPSTSPENRANAYFFSGICYLYEGLWAKTKEEFKHSLELYLAQSGPVHTNIGRIYSNLGYIIAEKEVNLEEAKVKYQDAIAIWTKHQGPFFPPLAHPYNNLGLIYWNEGEHEKALVIYRAALSLRLKTLSPQDPELAPILNNIGLILYEKGSLEDAHRYFLQALHIYRKAKDTNLAARATNNLGMIRHRQLKYADARRYYEQTLQVEEAQIPFDSAAVAVTRFNIGVTWREEGQYNTALDYFQRALLLSTPAHPQYAQMISSAGRCLEGMGKYDEALLEYEKAYAIQVKQYGEQHPMLAAYLFNQANVRIAERDWPRADALNRQAQKKLGYEGGSSFTKVVLLFDLCTVLAQESQIQYLLATEKKEGADWQKVISTAENALLAYEQFARINQQPSERQVAKAAAFSTAEIAIAANCRRFQHTRDTIYWYNAFHHAERTKAMLLLEAMQTAKTLKNSKASPTLLEQERLMRTDLAKLEIALQEKLIKKINPTDSSFLVIALNRAILLEKHTALLQQIAEKGDPRLSLRTFSVKTIQFSLLEPEQSMLSYFVGDSSIFLFLIQPKHFEVHEYALDFPLASTVDSLKSGISDYHKLPLAKKTGALEKATVQNYTQSAQLMYDKLLSRVKPKLSKNLIIVPDGVLGYVPFEALLSKAPGRMGVFSSYPFLLKEHQISYCYSATLLREMRDKKHHDLPEKSVLALAPFFSDAPFASLRDSLITLENSGEEIAQVAKIWNGTAIYGQAASLDTFLQLAAQYRILHLSTHGKADDLEGDYAYLALADAQQEEPVDKLYARDLYNLELNADLVVLSACETGIGKLRRGEGIISLARAFAAAGAKSLVTSLWKVDDEKSKELLVGFYKYLQDGKPIDTALQQTKFDFLNNNSSDGGAFLHPFFWAGFIAIGDMGAMK